MALWPNHLAWLMYSRHQPNILINHNRRACLADFGLARTIPGFTSSGFDKEKSRGTPVWMSPEVCWPDNFGFGNDARPRKESDVYALGTVIYEVCSLQFGCCTRDKGRTGHLRAQTFP